MSENAVAEGASAGSLLREAREAAGLHVATLAANLKVPVRKLEALEEDRYDLLPDAVFVRALASSVCRTLKIDPQPVLGRLPQSAQPRLVTEGEGINAPFRASSDGPGPSWLAQVPRATWITAALLVLAALVLLFQPLVQRGYDTVMQANAPTDPVMPPPNAGIPAPVTTAPAEPPLQPATDSSTPATGAAPAPATPAPATAAAPGAPAPTGTAVTAAVTPPPAAAPIPARGVVQFRTRGPSWIQVTDATGATVLQRLMEAGETVGATGTLPLSVTVGSVEATEVQVRGKPFNLAPVSRDNVARFEVK